MNRINKWVEIGLPSLVFSKFSLPLSCKEVYSQMTEFNMSASYDKLQEHSFFIQFPYFL